MTYAVLWIVAIVAFLILEASTAALVSIWFAGGSLAALVAYAFGADFKLQMFVFLSVSLLLVVLLRKVAFKSTKDKSKTNLDRIIGQEIVIAEAVDNKRREGTALVNDVEWKVKSENGENIPSGETVTVVDIEGVRLVVKK